MQSLVVLQGASNAMIHAKTGNDIYDYAVYVYTGILRFIGSTGRLSVLYCTVVVDSAMLSTKNSTLESLLAALEVEVTASTS
jgi:hypothetical protein